MRYILWVTGMLKGVLLRNGGLGTSDMKYYALICSENSLQMETRQKERTDMFKVLPHVQLKEKMQIAVSNFPKSSPGGKEIKFQILQGFTFLGQV